MLALLVILLIVFLLVGGVGFLFKGLFWLVILGFALFVLTAVVGLIGHARGRLPWKSKS